MTGGSGAKDSPHTLSEEERAPGEDVFVWSRGTGTSRIADLGRRASPEVRQTAVGQRPVYWILGIGFVLGMAAYVGGYALRSSVTTEPLRFVGDLLYTLGWALWTGVVVVVFLQVLPDAKRRQYRQALDAYEAALRDKALAEGDASGNDEASTSA
jgi:hypothetical protein